MFIKETQVKDIKKVGALENSNPVTCIATKSDIESNLIKVVFFIIFLMFWCQYPSHMRNENMFYKSFFSLYVANISNLIFYLILS